MKPSNIIPVCTICKGQFFSHAPAKRINVKSVNVRPIWKHRHCEDN
jgi:hypothetical protein